MANRLMANRSYTHERDVKTVYAKVAIGAAGAPTLDAANSKGVLSVTRNSAGDYTFVFGVQVNGVNVLDTYFKLLNVSMSVQNATGVPVTSDFGIKAINISNSALASVELVTVAPTSSAVTTPIPADPANGDILYVEFEFSDSSGA
jgi:hypothetical protein